MATFVTAYTDLLDYWNRPSAEMLSQAKREINNAILWLQRKRPFKFTERLIRVTIPANAQMVSVSSACEGLPRNYISIEKLSAAANNAGLVMKIVSYDRIIRDRKQYQMLHTSAEFAEDSLTDPFTFGDAISENDGGRMFLMGADNIGIYPSQTVDSYFLVHLNIWLPQLVADGDTNFFLTYAYDLVLFRALVNSSIYLKIDQRYATIKDDMVDQYQALVDWDDQVRAPTNA